MKKLLIVLVLVAVLATPVALVSADTGNVSIGKSVREYGHPVYIWNGTVLMDVLYSPRVGYDYAEIEAAFYAITRTVCGHPGERECWYGRQIGALKDIVTVPHVVAGFYYNKWDGKYYLIDTGECLLKDGCLTK